jgi:hypothetical protein
VTRGSLADTFELYRRAFARAATLFGRNPVLIVPVLATVGVQGFWPVLAPLGFLGGIAMVLLESMCWSALLATTGDTIRTGRVNVVDVRAGFLAYLGDVLNVRFVLWLLTLVLGLTPPSPLHVLVPVAVFVFFNAVPELIYLGRHGTGALLAASYRFMSENWIEWAPPNVLLVFAMGAVVVFGFPLLVALTGPGIAQVALLAVLASLLAIGMLVRGLLFLDLTQSSRRARSFQRRAS